MSHDLFSDFPVGGCVHSNPISPGGEVPFSASDGPVSARIAIERALRSGSRSQNFTRCITDIVSKIPPDVRAIDLRLENEIRAIGVKCRAATLIDKCMKELKALGSQLLTEDAKKVARLERKPKLQKEQSEKQKKLLDVLTSGTRSSNFSRQISEIVSKMPDFSNGSETYYIDCVLSLAAKCRCSNAARFFFGLERVKVEKHLPKRREKLTDEQRLEKRRFERRIWKKHQRRTNPSFRIEYALRRRLKDALKQSRKTDRTLVLLGCSLADFCKHLESRWQDGMSWNNYGARGWHIDHIKPCAAFDLTDPSQQRECFHYTNLQPLWAKENLRKGSVYKGLCFRQTKSRSGVL